LVKTLFFEAMKHTFILQEGRWIGKGCYIDDDDQVIPFEGEITTTHLNKEWVHENIMKLLLQDRTIEVHNRQEIVPFKENKSITTWKSDDPDLGTLSGKYVIVDDSILSVCFSKNGKLQGSEYFMKIDDTTYKNRGTLTKQGKKLSSWVIDLTRIE